MRADLTKKATLASMTRLSNGTVLEALESPGHEPTTPAEEFEDRNGYVRDFLNGWSIEFPQPTGERAADMRRLSGKEDTELKYQNFSVIMSAERRMPMLTAVNIDGTESKSVPRISVWSFDGRLDKAHQWGDELYANNELDRGHMVRREDPIWGSPEIALIANKDTFHFTNSCPQMAGVNQKTWVGLENYVLQHARADGMRVSVFTGPYFTGHDLDYRGAKVPFAFWKIVAIVKEDGTPSATAYKVSQARELEDLEFVYAGYKTYQISIKQVMDDTGIDFTALVEYDGFSQHENKTGDELEEKLESLSDIRL